VLEILGLHEPRLVGEHVEARLVQAAHGARLAAVPAREHDHVAAPLADEAVERIVGDDHEGTPAGGLLRAPVEALDEREKVPQLTALARVDDDLVGRAGLRHAQRERGVEVAGVEEEQRVHRPRPTLARLDEGRKNRLL
jgi:hypothetical protein